MHSSSRLTSRWIALVAAYLIVGILGAWYLLDTTAIGADLATYQRAGDALWSNGDPYATAASVPEDYRYRYPPLLAMIIPVLGWPPLWFGLIAIATVVPIYVAYRVAGPAGLLPPALLIGAWGQQLLNGNAQAIVVALLAIVPLRRRTGAVGLAVASMLKLHPALAVVWYLGRRDWGALAWFSGAIVLLTVLQLPWLRAMLDFYLVNPMATETIPGMSLRAVGVVTWIAGTLAAGVAALWFARSRYGWLLATLFQLVALPRVLLVNLALLLAAPLPRPTEAASARSSRPAREATRG
jgi:hypothetical protein